MEYTKITKEEVRGNHLYIEGSIVKVQKRITFRDEFTLELLKYLKDKGACLEEKILYNYNLPPGVDFGISIRIKEPIEFWIENTI